MTAAVAPATTAPRKRISRKLVITLAVLVAAIAGITAYVAHFGECDGRSQYCVLDIAQTRSEIGFEWSSGPDLYVSTWPQGTTHTIVG